MVGSYWGSGSLLDSVEAGEEPLLLMGYGDATGGWRVASITHYETGIASWKQGASTSKLTLLPSHMHEDDDHAPNLRSRVASSCLMDGRRLSPTRSSRSSRTRPPSCRSPSKEIPVDFRMGGDFQIIKSINNMSLFTSPIWCECDKDAINFWPTEELPDWEVVEKHFDSPGNGIMSCFVKSLRRICQLNGWSSTSSSKQLKKK